MNRISPPVIPEGWENKGLRKRFVRCAWGKIRVPLRRLQKKDGSEYKQTFVDPSLDGSGWTPKALERLIDIAARLPFVESVSVLKGFGYKISSAELARLTDSYSSCCRKKIQTHLDEKEKEALKSNPNTEQRLFVLQIDGVRVLGKPINRVCNGIEIKSVVLYEVKNPRERWMFADIVNPKQLKSMLSGLLREAGITKQDKLVGIGDGASWVEGCFEWLGIDYVTDVYHSVSYAEEVMKALGWDEHRRGVYRKNWCKGKVNVGNWLKKYVSKSKRRKGRVKSDQEARVAYYYLQERVDHMNYPAYKKDGWPIGSGQVEGMNKSVIGKRMKCSGMQWSTEGAANMAALRAQVCSTHPIIQFETLRHEAFPHYGK